MNDVLLNQLKKYECKYISQDNLSWLISKHKPIIEAGLYQGWACNLEESSIQFDLWYLKYGYYPECPFDIDFDEEIMNMGREICDLMFMYCLKEFYK